MQYICVLQKKANGNESLKNGQTSENGHERNKNYS